MRFLQQTRWLGAGLLIAVLPSTAQANSCSPGPFLVFFDSNETYLDHEAAEIMESASSQLGACGSAYTMIMGHTDSTENASLARRRANVVRDYLEAHGLPRSYITIRSSGSRRPRVSTIGRTAERQNRRVDMMFGIPR